MAKISKEVNYIITVDKEELLEILKSLEERQSSLLSFILSGNKEVPQDYLEKNKELYYKSKKVFEELYEDYKSIKGEK